MTTTTPRDTTPSSARTALPGPPRSERSFVRSQRANERMQALVPGGCHTYAKGVDQYPEYMAPVIERGLGSHVWDLDGNEFIEYGSGLRAVSLGHADPRVNEAVVAALAAGTNFARPAGIELAAAEDLLRIVPRADMVKFAKNGSDATTAAVRLARAVTGRDLVALCRDQPFFSTDDWFIGSTVMDSGIPGALSDLSVRFPFNDGATLERLFLEHAGRVACVVMEAATDREPLPGYLAQVRQLCDDHGALLILDEMITGFRWSIGGAQDVYDVSPDLATFGKAMGNGYAVSALVGRREYMRLGGLDHDERRVFLLSTTHGAETHALAAARAVIDIYETDSIIETLTERGEQLAAGVRAAASDTGVADHVQVLGRPGNLIYATLDGAGERSQEFRTLFLSELLRRGVLAPSFVVGASHTDRDIEFTIDAVHDACRVYRKALENGIDGYLGGRAVRPVFRRFA